ncbi:FecR family protein [Mucilaginibacter sp.]|uniref:FecR family protein n=1 Tax=Mucilaginibacter sp. TaxID=1882438 RepID=UPI003D145AA9
MKKATLRRLLRQYLNNTISSTDCNELLSYLSNTDPDEIADIVDEDFFSLDEGPAFSAKQSNEVLNRIQADPRFAKVAADHVVSEPKVIKFYQKRWLQVAAAVLVFVTGGLLTVYNTNSLKSTNKLIAKQKATVIVPGGQKAILTMGNGKTIVLDSAANGLLAKTGTSNVLKTHNGQIIYNTGATANDAADEVSYNTLSTPKGGEYQVVLPDGTKVWLNAASSITYPVAFVGNERRVKLTGEAYFEVAKNKSKPFYVKMNNDVEVKVLGTHFNIAAYSDDAEITTTLLEGSVQITKNKAQSLLSPGQQAVINYKSDNIAVSEANIDDAMAWKNGYFIFNDDNITGIMKKISRWYDVDVEYKGTIPDQNFGGTFHRSKSITELLHHLEKIGKIHFKVSGRRITVMA